MSTNNNGFTPRKKNALDNYGFNVAVPVNGEQGKYSNLSWEVTRNNLGIRVYTGYSSDKGNKNGLIRARLDGINFFAFLELLREATEGSGKISNKIEYTDFTFFGGKRSERPQLISTVYVGRDEDGVVWVSVVDSINKDRPRIKFIFGEGRNYNFKNADGTPFTQAKTSQILAKSFYNMLSNMGSYVMTQEYVEPKPKENNNNSGGYQNKNNNSNNGDDISDGDLPF